MHAGTRLCAICGAALWLAMIAGCASAPGRLDGPREVFSLELKPYAVIEDCIALEAGERVAYRFDARLPVAFNVHFHDGNAVVMPLTRDNTTSESGDFSADREQIYCLTWEAGAGGSILDYRVGPWPPHR
jgi:hypothetical protein